MISRLFHGPTVSLSVGVVVHTHSAVLRGGARMMPVCLCPTLAPCSTAPSPLLGVGGLVVVGCKVDGVLVLTVLGSLGVCLSELEVVRCLSCVGSVNTQLTNFLELAE